LDSVSVRGDELVKDGAISAVTRVFDALWRRRLRRSTILDKLITTNNWQPSDQGRPSIGKKRRISTPLNGPTFLLLSWRNKKSL
jgi:hypothetical protein